MDLSVILVRSQIAENIGTAARAMMNCGLYDMRLVAPHESHLCDKAICASSGADEVLKRATVFATVEEAIADMNYVLASTARKRDMVKEVFTAESGITSLRSYAASGLKVAVMFGPERTGLENDDVALCNGIIEIPLNPKHCSLNLAQAVLLVGYEWFKAQDSTPPVQMIFNDSSPANHDDMQNLYDALETRLDECGYYKIEEKKPRMVRNLRNIFNRANLTQQEVRTLHGVFKMLSAKD